MEVGNNDSRGNWELQKENIQPLSSGRKVSLLAHSLDTSKTMAEHEQEMNLKIKQFEENITSYKGDDPIEPWVAYIQFLENTCLLVAKFKVQLQDVLFKCVKIFHAQPEHNNDKRFVEIYIRCLKEMNPEKRVQVLRNALTRNGIGKTVSEMYIVISEIEESLGKNQQAAKIIREGIQNNAQPIGKLQEVLHQLEYRVAQRLAQPQDNDAGSRNFGCSVPVFGKLNDAPPIRVDLPSAVPFPSNVASSNSVAVRQGQRPSGRQGLQPLELFVAPSEGDDDTSPEPHSSNMDILANPVSETEIKKSDKENRLRPSKWNKPETVILEDVVARPYETPRERLQLYTDEEENTASKLEKLIPSSSNQQVPLGSAQDVAAANGSTSHTSSTLVASDSSLKYNLVCKKAIMLNGVQVSFEERRRKIWLNQHADTKKAEEAYAKLSHKEQECKALMRKYNELNQRFEDYKSTTNDRLEQLNQLLTKETQEKARLAVELSESTEKLRCYELKIENLTALVELHKEKEQELTALLAQEKEKAAMCMSTSSGNSGSTNNSGPSSSERTFLPKPTEEKENGDMTFFPRQKQRETFNASVKMGTTYFVKEDTLPVPRINDELSQSDWQLRNSPNEMSAADISDFMPPPMISRKLPFTLYETQMESMSSVSRMTSSNRYAPPNAQSGSSSATNDKFTRPAPLNYKMLSENLPPPSRDLRNSLRTFGLRKDEIDLAGEEVEPNVNDQNPNKYVEVSICQPNVKAEATGGNLDESAFIPSSQQYGSDLNFNDSNITRVLALNPHPLLNSTPENISDNDEMDEYENLNNVGNFIHTQRLPQLKNPRLSSVEGPMSPESLQRYEAKFGERTRNDQVTSLSPIQETSKENRSCCTTGSSSSNMTSNRGMSRISTASGVSMYNSRSVSGGPPKSVSRLF